jgi:hypothetical protein
MRRDRAGECRLKVRISGFWQLCRRRVSLRRGPTRPRPRFALARLVLAFTGRLIRLAGADLVGVLCWFAALLFAIIVFRLDRHRSSRDACNTTSPATWGQAGRQPSRGRQYGQQCFPCAGSRAKCERGAILIGLRRSCTAGAREARFAQGPLWPSKPTIVQAKSIVSSVPIADIRRTSTNHRVQTSQSSSLSDGSCPKAVLRCS